jgi:hemin uptake protein HemP
MTFVKPKILHKPNKLGLPTKSATPDSSNAPAGVEGVASDKLLGAQGELKIRHNGETYSLRKTRFNKLILTK